MRYLIGLSIVFACLATLTAASASDTPTPPAEAAKTTTPPAPLATTDGAAKPADEENKAEEAKDATGSATTTDSREEEIVCKRIEKATGSRIGTKRVCMTVREWGDYRED